MRTQSITIRASYASDCDALFASALSFESLRNAMAGLAVYDGLPATGVMTEGKQYETDIWFWRILPVRRHVIRVDTVDWVQRYLETHETHAGIKLWRHQTWIEPRGDASVWNDRIDIRAGFQTPFVARFARYVYVRRHHAQKAIGIDSKMGV